jgi:hypothetical protein
MERAHCTLANSRQLRQVLANWFLRPARQHFVSILDRAHAIASAHCLFASSRQLCLAFAS